MSTRPGDVRGEVAAATDHGCRACGFDVSHLPPTAKYCPHCGAGLAPPHETVKDLARRPVRWTTAVLCGVRSICRGWHAGMGEPYRGDGDRSKVVTGYGNALFNLGWRYERGWGVRRNLPEALRC